MLEWSFNVKRGIIMKLCLVIPNYNHGSTILPLLERLAVYNLYCIIVDDGSLPETKQKLSEAQQLFNWVEVITLPFNSGKGVAIRQGFERAEVLGFTHCLQIDADGQHDTNDVAKFIAKSQQHPQSLISGHPIYDACAPKSRLYGRKITNFWVAIATWSTSISDAMCGFRIYPLAKSLAIFRSSTVGKRMDFDTELLVRLYWENVPVQFIPTAVIYPESGISHFKLWQDNYRITKMHTRLFFAMLINMPKLLMNRCKNGKPS